MRYSTISQLGDFTAFTLASTDYWQLDASQCSGGDDADLRTTVEDAPGQSGVYVEPPLGGQQIITLKGPLEINSDGSETGYLAAQDTLFAALRAALDAMMVAPDDLVSSDGTLKVWKYSKLDHEWSGIVMVPFVSVVVDPFAS